MRKILNIAKWGLTLGREPQTFLGAKWIPAFLKRSSGRNRRLWALRILSFSPHYFIRPDSPEFAGLTHNEYLEKAFANCAVSREKIYEHILQPHLKPADRALDYGCGPGFLAKVVAPKVEYLYACDISTGALACAGILNAAPNLKYVVANTEGLGEIPDGSLDVIFSFALIQHLTDGVFEMVLSNCRRMLKTGGLLVLHIKLLDEFWKTEDEWKNDTSIEGKLKYKYGLHCFGRTEEKHIEIVKSSGFENVAIEEIAKLVPENFDDICSQHLLTAIKSR